MKIGSLCSGIGGLDLALEAFGAETIWHCENDPFAARVLSTHWPDTPNYLDVKHMDWSLATPIDILTAGYPCQPFSLAGQRKGIDDERHLWPAVANAIRVLRPRYVFLENVASHLSLGFDAVLADLAVLGFDARWGIVRASDVGAPHQRRRLFVVARDPNSEPWLEWRKPASNQTQAGWARANPGGSSGASLTDASGNAVRVEPIPQSGSEGAAVAGGGSASTTDADGLRQQKHAQSDSESVPAEEWQGSNDLDGLGDVAWGDYEAAIRRWERVVGSSPDPLVYGRLNADFVDWMMGFPPGWTDVGIPKSQRLKCAGNAVVAQAGSFAFSRLAEL